MLPGIARTAQEQLKRVSAIAPWLNNEAPLPDDFALWDSSETPLYDQLVKLDGVDELHLIAPFIDSWAVQQLMEHFLPSRLIVGTDALSPNVAGQSLDDLCKSLGCDLELRGLSATNSQVKRRLHAKAMIGVHQDGSWCITGSANITRPALFNSWRGRGNMETVVFRTAANPKAFEALWQDELITSRQLSIHDAVINAEEPEEQDEAKGVRLVDLVARDNEISGHVVFTQPITPLELKLSLRVSNAEYLLALDENDPFSVSLERPLSRPEAAVLRVLCDDNTKLVSAETFIDQLHELEHYGAEIVPSVNA